MSNNNWITDRPPTEDEVPDDARTICTLRNGMMPFCRGLLIRNYWKGNGSTDPIAWMMPPEPFVPEAADVFDSQDFYELMQAYRWCGRVPVVDHQPDVEKAFQDVIAFIREQLSESEAGDPTPETVADVACSLEVWADSPAAGLMAGIMRELAKRLRGGA